MRVWFCTHKLGFPLRCSTAALCAQAASDWHCQRSGGGKAEGGASSMRRRQPAKTGHMQGRNAYQVAAVPRRPASCVAS